MSIYPIATRPVVISPYAPTPAVGNTSLTVSNTTIEHPAIPDSASHPDVCSALKLAVDDETKHVWQTRHEKIQAFIKKYEPRIDRLAKNVLESLMLPSPYYFLRLPELRDSIDQQVNAIDEESLRIYEHDPAIKRQMFILWHEIDKFTQTYQTLTQDLSRDIEEKDIDSFKAMGKKIKDHATSIKEQLLQAKKELYPWNDNLIPSRTLTIIPEAITDAKDARKIKRTAHRIGLSPSRSTGYWIKKGESLTVDLAYNDNLPPSPLPHIRIYPKNISDNFQKKILSEGRNIITSDEDGMIYISADGPSAAGQYTVDLSDGGHPIPRFVLGEHTHQDWKTMAAHSDAPFAEFVGKRTMITVPLSSAKVYVDNPEKLLTLWDSVIEASDKQYGLHAGQEALDEPRKGRVHFISSPIENGMMSPDIKISDLAGFVRDKFIYISLQDLPSILSMKEIRSNKFDTDNDIPLHELGHLQELIDLYTAFNCKKHIQFDFVNNKAEEDVVTETVNELTTIYIREKVLGQITLPDKFFEFLWERVDSHLKRPKSERNWHDLTFDAGSTLGHRGTKIGLYWQLRLAFGNQFYEEFGRLSRRLTLIDETDIQAREKRLIILSSKASGYNLIPFFEEWGFKIADETKEDIKKLNLKPLDQPIWENTVLDVKHKFYEPSEAEKQQEQKIFNNFKDKVLNDIGSGKTDYYAVQDIFSYFRKKIATFLQHPENVWRATTVENWKMHVDHRIAQSSDEADEKELKKLSVLLKKIIDTHNWPAYLSAHTDDWLEQVKNAKNIQEIYEIYQKYSKKYDDYTGKISDIRDEVRAYEEDYFHKSHRGSGSLSQASWQNRA